GKHGKAVAGGHFQIQEDRVGVLPFDASKRLFAIAGLNHSVAVCLQGTGEAEPNRPVVLGNQDRPAGFWGHAHRRVPPAVATSTTGSVRVKTAPPPGRFSAVMSPRWASAISRAI